MDEGRGQLAELLFAGMSDDEFNGLVEGLNGLLDRLREALPASDAERP